MQKKVTKLSKKTRTVMISKGMHRGMNQVEADKLFMKNCDEAGYTKNQAAELLKLQKLINTFDTLTGEEIKNKFEEKIQLSLVTLKNLDVKVTVLGKHSYVFAHNNAEKTQNLVNLLGAMSEQVSSMSMMFNLLNISANNLNQSPNEDNLNNTINILQDMQNVIGNIPRVNNNNNNNVNTEESTEENNKSNNSPGF